jgi:hypothetical protein
MTSEVLLTFLLRLGQALIAGAPGVLAGVVVAGAIGTVIPVRPAGDGGGGRSLRRLLAVRAWLLLVPLTSLGALFVAERLRRLGYPRHLVLLALLSGGLAPWAIAWGMSKAGALTVLGVVAAAAAVPVFVAAGVAWAGRAAASASTTAKPGVVASSCAAAPAAAATSARCDVRVAGGGGCSRFCERRGGARGGRRWCTSRWASSSRRGGGGGAAGVFRT